MSLLTLVAEFSVPGPPVAWARPRIAQSGTGPSARRHFRTSDADAAHRKMVAMCACARGALRPDVMLDGVALKLDCTFMVPIPPSTSKQRREWMLAGRLLPTSKPDASNYVKLVEDALIGILYKDDALVTDIAACKRYSDEPRTDVRLFTVAHV